MATQRLSDKFIVPPFSVIDGRKWEWRKRKQCWQAEIGRVSTGRDNALYDSMAMRLPDLYKSSKEEREALGLSFDEYVASQNIEVTKEAGRTTFAGVSSFDPALAEVLYHWFIPGPHASIYDCFCGDITKGYVACKCGHSFVGIDIRGEQIDFNKVVASTLGVNPWYINDDGGSVQKYLGYATQDLLITCPPYFNLERYSSKEGDVSSSVSYEDYIRNMGRILGSAVKCLKSNRFAVIIISDVRDNAGAYRSLPEDIISIMRSFGLMLWNDIVYINNDSHAQLRASRYMNNRKVVRMHQRVLVFYQGNPNSISKIFPKPYML